MKKTNWTKVLTARALVSIFVTSFILLVSTVVVTAQRKESGVKRSANGTLRVWVPSGIVGGEYWIYLDDRLKGAKTTEAKSAGLNPISFGDGWEVWGSEGLVVSSKRWDGWLKPYVAAGDRYGIFQPVEFAVAAGMHGVELMVPTTGPSRSVSPLPFALSSKQAARVNAGATSDVYLSIPADWSNRMRPMPPAAWVSPCGDATFRLREMQDSYLAWGRVYQNNPIIKLLHSVRGSIGRGSTAVEIDSAAGSREYGRTQLEQILGLIDLNAGDRFNHDRTEITYCKSKQPQFSKAFDEYEKTIAFIEDDIASLQRMVSGMGDQP